MSALLWLSLLVQLILTEAWPSYTALFGASHRFQPSSPYSSTWHAIRAVQSTERQQQQQSKYDGPVVKHLTNLRYNGLNYIMVHNLSLAYDQAERYCNTEFSQKMHLASVLSENEWEILSKTFSLPYPSEVWLGGQSYYADSGLFLMKWVDDKPFEYHRFSTEEMSRWQANWRFGGHGCIFGAVQSDARGNWSVQLAPCSEPRRFVCKEEGGNNDSKLGQTKSVSNVQRVNGHMNGLASIMQMLFGSRIFYREPAERQNHFAQLPHGRWHPLGPKRTQTQQSPENEVAQTTTPSSLKSQVPVNIPVRVPDNAKPADPSDVTKTAQRNSPSAPEVSLDQAQMSQAKPNVVANNEANGLTKPRTAVSWSIPQGAPKNDGPIQSTKIGFNVISSPKLKDAVRAKTNQADQKGTENSIASQASQAPAAQVILDADDMVNMDANSPYFYSQALDPNVQVQRPPIPRRLFNGNTLFF